MAIQCIPGATSLQLPYPSRPKSFVINDLQQMQDDDVKNTAMQIINSLSAWLEYLNLGMQRLYAIGDGLQLCVVFSQPPLRVYRTPRSTNRMIRLRTGDSHFGPSIQLICGG